VTHIPEPQPNGLWRVVDHSGPRPVVWMLNFSEEQAKKAAERANNRAALAATAPEGEGR
jgi:hypothetical protein